MHEVQVDTSTHSKQETFSAIPLVLTFDFAEEGKSLCQSKMTETRHNKFAPLASAASAALVSVMSTSTLQPFLTPVAPPTIVLLQNTG